MIRTFLASVTRISDLTPDNFDTTPLPRNQWDTGDYVVGKVTDISGHLSAIELPNGRMINVMVVDLIDTSRSNIEDASIASTEDVRTHDRPIMAFSDDMRELIQELMTFLRINLYQHYCVHRMTLKAENVISSLFDAFINDPKLLPPEAMQHCQELIADDSDEDMARGIADYIAGMTDRYAIIEFERVLNPRQLSIANLIP